MVLNVIIFLPVTEKIEILKLILYYLYLYYQHCNKLFEGISEKIEKLHWYYIIRLPGLQLRDIDKTYIS